MSEWDLQCKLEHDVSWVAEQWWAWKIAITATTNTLLVCDHTARIIQIMRTAGSSRHFVPKLCLSQLSSVEVLVESELPRLPKLPLLSML